MIGFKEETLHFDVVIVGGGMTGLCAAIASARHGAKTALVQDRPVLGGNASSEIRMHICGATANMKKPELSEGGIVHELMLSNKRVNDSYNFSIWDAVLFQAAKNEKNLTLLLNTTMHAATCQDGEITCIECYQMSTEKRLLIHGKIFADCTGNGTLGAFVGVKSRTGSEGKAEFNEPHAPEQPNQDRMGNTLLFKAANVGHPVKFIPPVDAMHFTEEQLRYRKHSADVPKEVLAKASENEIWMLFDGYCQDYGYWWIEIGGESADIISEYEDIRDQLVRAVYGVWDHIKNGGNHGAENYELVWVGMLPGVRESRRMEGEYMLNENDLLENRVFDDAVAYGGWPVDNHVEHGLLDFDKMPSEIYAFNGLYTIPYRSYVAKDMDNLFIGGRSMGASKLAMASSRVMGTCAVGGQAVGTAAALCKKYGCTPHEVEAHMKELQQMLLKDDCYIPGYKNEDPADLARAAQVSAGSEKQPAANVINGVARTVGRNENCWQSDGLAGDNGVLSLKWDAPHTLRQVRLTFDPNLCSSIKITLSSKRIAEQVPGVPPELVRDYDVELLKDGQVLASRSVRGNYQRLNVLNFDACDCDEVRLHVLATNGIADARVYEVRAYEQAD